MVSAFRRKPGHASRIARILSSMRRGASVRLGILTVAVSALLLCITPTSRPRTEALPQRLDDQTFWTLITEFSEPGGNFRSDNLVSNEMSFEQVIPTLQRQVMPA